MSQVVRRAAAILRALEDHPEGCSVAEIANEVGLPRSSVHRVLKALEDEHLVASASAEGGFRLGPALMHLATSANSWLIATVHPHLEKVSAELDETVDLAVLSGLHVYFIDQVAAPHRLQALSKTGLAFPVHCTANGKALLADLDDDQVTVLLGDELGVHTPNTITDPAALIAELDAIRSTGVAFDREEHHRGVTAIGTKICNPYGLALALSVPVPTSRFTDRETELVDGLLEARHRLETHLARAASTEPAQLQP